jgi:hypothetical protein
MGPVHLIDEFVQVLDERSDLALFEFAVEALQSLRREVLDDDPISLVRRCRSMSGRQQGNRRVISVTLDAIELAATDHLRLCFHSG